MIIVKRNENQDIHPYCDGCNRESTIFTYIEISNPISDDKKGLFLCPTCRSALKDELILTPNPCHFSYVEIVLKREIDILKVDLQCLSRQWKEEYGLPYTKDRLNKYKNGLLTVGIFRLVESINECERIIELVKYDDG